MSSLPGLLERRELLVARSALLRLEIARDVQDLRTALSWPRAGLGRIVRIAAAAFAVFKLARALRRP